MIRFNTMVISMKKTVIWAAALALVISASGCGNISKKNESAEKEKTDSKAAAAESQTAIESSAESETDSKSRGNKKPDNEETDTDRTKAVMSVVLVPKDGMGFQRKVRFSSRDIRDKVTPHRDVVSLVGEPVEVKLEERDEANGGKLAFFYDPNELKGVRPDALMFLWYDEENDKYVEFEDVVLDTDYYNVSIDIEKPGVYMLVNKYQWYNEQGKKLDDDGMEKEFKPHISSKLWERSMDTGDILKLKDDDYIAKSQTKDGYAYEFYVSTPEELASVVYVNNCANPRPDSITVNIVNDIDLDGYKWAPMGWKLSGTEFNFDFTGTIYGGHHKIKDMRISEGYEERFYVGFIGNAESCTVNALDFENAYVHGKSDVGILAGDPKSSFFTECNVQGVTEGNISVGTMIGDDSYELLKLGKDYRNHMENCTADVTVNGKKVTGYLSYTALNKAEVQARVRDSEEIWLDGGGRPCRNKDLDGKYFDLVWKVTHNGKVVLTRNAENEYCYEWHEYKNVFYENGEYEIALQATIDGADVEISNTVVVTVDDNTKFIS